MSTLVALTMLMKFMTSHPRFPAFLCLLHHLVPHVSTWSSPGDCNDAVIMPVNVLNNGECALGNSSDAVVIPVNAPDSNNAVKQNNNECEGQSCRQQLVALMTVPYSKTNKNRQLNSLFVTLEDYSRVTVIKFGLNDISRRQRRDTC